MTSIAQQIFAIFEKDGNAIVTVKTLRGKVVTGKIIMLDYRSFGLQHESGDRDLFLISQIKSVLETGQVFLFLVLILLFILFRRSFFIELEKLKQS